METNNLSDNYQLFFNAIDEFLFVLDEQGNILEVNNTVISRLGYSKEELVGQPILMVHPVDRQQEAGRIVGEMMAGKTKSCPVPIISKDNIQISVETKITHGFWNGKPALFGVTKDISQIKLSEGSLKNREKLLIGLSKATDCVLSDKVLTKKNITDAFEALGLATNVDRVYIFEHLATTSSSRGLMSQRYEWSRNNIAPQIDNPALQNVPWDDMAPRWYDAFMNGSIISGNVVDFPESERSILDPQKIISILVLPIHVHNKFWGFIGFDDCTKKREWSSSEIGLLRSTANSFAVVIERMRAEQTLAENTWRLENIIKSTNVGTWEWNIQTGELITNDRWAQIVGYTTEELCPISIETWKKIAHPDDLKQSMALLTKHFSGELPYYEFEGRMKHKDGHWVWISDHGKVATFTKEGKPLMMLGTHVDISERKRLEEIFRDQKEKTEVMNKLMVGRELKMIELKNEIELLKKAQSG